MKILFIDTETTGINPKTNDIIQISGIIEIDGVVKDEFDFRVKPRDFDSISPEALQVTGMTIEQLKGFEDADSIHKKFCQKLARFVNKFDRNDKFYIAGYNVRFDVDFLKSFFDKSNDPYFGSWINWKLIDPMPILHFMEYRGKINLENYKLGTVCQHFNIPLDAHDALNDIRATREVIRRIQL